MICWKWKHFQTDNKLTTTVGYMTSLKVSFHYCHLETAIFSAFMIICLWDSISCVQIKMLVLWGSDQVVKPSRVPFLWSVNSQSKHAYSLQLLFFKMYLWTVSQMIDGGVTGVNETLNPNWCNTFKYRGYLCKTYLWQ